VKIKQRKECTLAGYRMNININIQGAEVVEEEVKQIRGDRKAH
jgi:hypothetical protein